MEDQGGQTRTSEGQIEILQKFRDLESDNLEIIFENIPRLGCRTELLNPGEEEKALCWLRLRTFQFDVRTEMAVETTNRSFPLEELIKVEGPWLPPKTWESIPTESGGGELLSASHSRLAHDSSNRLYEKSAASEASMVRLGMNALQGMESALIRIEHLSEKLCSDPADRTFHRIPSLWTRSSSTHAVGKILKSIWSSGCLVFLLRHFVDHFTNTNHDEAFERSNIVNSELLENQDNLDDQAAVHPPYSLVNQAFSVAVGQVLDGYVCALDTMGASVGLRRSGKSSDLSFLMSSGGGCLTDVLHNETTLLELDAHSKELRTHIQALGNICNLNKDTFCFSTSSLRDMAARARLEFCNFPKAGDLLTYLYLKLEFADPVHSTLLKFLFLRSCEPYCSLIRSWIYEANISDPYKEFIVDHVENPLPYFCGKAGVSVDLPLETTRERDEVAVPCFLKNFSIPLFRAGQQLQILKKLPEMCNLETADCSFEEILPSWSGFSDDQSSIMSQITFSKRSIEAVVTARNKFYESLQRRLENFVVKLDIRNHQVVPHTLLSVDGFPNIPNLCALDSFSVDDTDKLVANSYADSEASNSADEFPNVVDPLESSECSSLHSCENEENESEKLFETPSSIFGPEQRHLRALSILSSMPVHKSRMPLQYETSQLTEAEGDSCDQISSLSGVFYPLHFKESNFGGSFRHLLTEDFSGSWMSQSLHLDSHFDKLTNSAFQIDGKCDSSIGSQPLEIDTFFKKKPEGIRTRGAFCFSEKLPFKDSFREDTYDKNEKFHVLSDTHASKSWKQYDSNFFSMNPMLKKTASFDNRSLFQEKYSRENLPYYNFSFVEDPLKLEKIASISGNGLEPKLPIGTGSGDSVAKVVDNHYCSDDRVINASVIDRENVSCSLPFQPDNLKGNLISSDVCGGNGWERLLVSSGQMVSDSVGDQKQSLASAFEMPLHFIIKECIQQEIMLQYKYISKLTIKFLEEGFKLQEHLMALRRYHFMEVADWADLFIMSLSHRKGCLAEANKRISEIQGQLELSIQRSSCERDEYKNKLFVFMKGEDFAPQSASSIGIHSFDFLGLGYRVDWPVSIVLTPEALNIYSQIFNFLIEVKLAVLALTDVWCSLKDLMDTSNRSHHFLLKKPDAWQFNVLIKLRHQLNHFVMMLQQYVLSQLTHVSWFRLLHSLKHKVKDMMDFELLHMAYLTDSLRICFLRDGIPSIDSIIGRILQCALDFRSSLSGGTWGVEQGPGNSSSKFSNISQVLSIKKTFDNSLKELYVCYLKSPKHGDFGLARFWGYLNYNEYYLDALGTEMGQYAFSV